MLKKIAHEPSGVQIVKSQKMSVFYNALMLISSSNGTSLSRSKCTQTLILCKFIFKFIIRDY